MLKKINEVFIKLLLKREYKWTFEKNGENWGVIFWKKTQTKWRCHQTFKRMPLKSKLGSGNWTRSSKNKKKLWKKSVKRLVKLLKGEKSSNFKTIFKSEKKTWTTKKCFKSAKSSKTRKKQFKMKTNIEQLRRNLRTIIESFEKKAWKDQKTANLEKSVKFEKIMKKLITMF